MKHTLPAILLATLLTGCSSNTMKFPFSTLVPEMPQHKMETRTDEARNNKWICVLQPPDASYFGEAYHGSGKAVTGIVRHALQKVGTPSVQVQQVQSNAFADCLERGAKRFLQVTFLHYEDRSGRLFGKPHRIELKLSLFTLDNLDNRKSVVYEAQSSVLRRAVLEWTDSKPTALLGDAFERAVWQLVEMKPEQATQADSFGLN
jgi:hypothetical protein